MAAAPQLLKWGRSTAETALCPQSAHGALLMEAPRRQALPLERQWPKPYLWQGGRPAAPAECRPSEPAARSSLARPWAFFRDSAWLSQSWPASFSDAPGSAGWLPLAGGPVPSVGVFVPKEEGGPAGAEWRTGAECWLAGGGRLQASLPGDGGSRSETSSLRPSQSAPPLLGWVGLEAVGVLCLEPASPLRSVPPSKNLLQDREEGSLRQGKQPVPRAPGGPFPPLLGGTRGPTIRGSGCLGPCVARVAAS